MEKWVKGLLLLLITLLSVCHAQESTFVSQPPLNLTEQEKQWIKQHPVIQFTGDPNWLPFEAFDQKGQYIGIVSEHLSIIEKKLAIKFDKVVTKTWTESVNLAKSGAVDVLSETDDSALKSHLLFSQYYVTNPVVIVMNFQQNYVENLQQIKSKKIGIIKNYGYVTKITDKYHEHNFVVVDDIQDGLLAVSTGRVDALLCTITLCGYTMSKLSLHDIKIVGKTEFETRLAFGVNKKLAPFVPILNKAIASISNKQRQEILDKWSLHDYVEKTDYSLFWQVLIISIILVSLLIYRQFKLHQHSNQLARIKDRYARAIRGTSDGLWDWNLISDEAYFSARWKSLLGYQEDELDNHFKTFYSRLHKDDIKKFNQIKESHLNNMSDFDLALRLKHKSQGYRWYRIVGLAEFDRHQVACRLAGTLSDINDRVLNERLDKSRNLILELIAQGQSFQKTLNAIVDSVEEENPHMLCSILLVDRESNRLLNGASPSLPEFYTQAIDGYEFADGVGSCGTAAATGKRVIVEDIQNHPYWENFKQLAARAKLASCWSDPIIDSNGKVIGTFAIYQRDVSSPRKNDLLIIEQASTLAGIAIERQRATKELQLASLVYQNSSEAMQIIDANQITISINDAFSKITGLSAEEVIGRRSEMINPEFCKTDFISEVNRQITSEGFWQGEVTDRRKNGEVYFKWLTINSIYNNNGSLHRRVLLFSDISEKKHSEKVIWRQANFDFLTGLPNRAMFNERLNREIANAKRNKGSFALLLIDLDHFKEINDTLGHDVGDVLLVEAAKRISASVRESDTVARLGGDEFTIIVTNLDKNIYAETISQKVLKELAKPFHLENELSYISASIGITVFPEDTTEAEELLKNADQAMYASKAQGRNCYQYFTRSMQRTAQQRMYLVAELRQAIEEKQFTLVYQPIVELANDKIYKAEALVRWQHPTKGIISPADFIPIAEETGMIITIGDWVLKQATTQVYQWRQRISQNFQITVNTSPAQYQANGFDYHNWFNQLKALELPGHAIIMEITESLMMDASNLIKEQLFAFRNSGIQVALDDFGTGYSSLAYLKKFDIDYIKIDQAFVKNLATDKDDKALCEAIIVMAHKLNLKVIAEGVETQKQKKLLTEMKCDYAQGYLFSQPTSAENFENILIPKK